jgi:tRNA(fMet)-specific endonuclease VapC
LQNSAKPGWNKKILDKFLTNIEIIPIFDTLDKYAEEKTRLRKAGTILDDFDLLIGSAAISYNLIMVTNNIQHFNRLNNIVLEDWTI